MNSKNTQPKCRTIRGWLFSAVGSRFGLDAPWVQKHIANCPRCRRRLAAAAKVNLAFSLIKSQSHQLDLLAKANQHTIRHLRRDVRDLPKAQKLKRAVPEPGIFERLSKYRGAVANIAACIAIMLMMKMGIFNSARKFQDDSRRAMHQYYSRNAGADLADEIFQS